MNTKIIKEQYGRIVEAVIPHQLNESQKEVLAVIASNFTKVNGLGTPASAMKFLNESERSLVNNKLNESATWGGNFHPVSTPYNTPGMGDPVLPSGFRNIVSPDASYALEARGSADLYPMMFGVATKPVVQAVGLELLKTIPITTPSGNLMFEDYVYSNGNHPFGANGTYNKPNPSSLFHKLNQSKLHTIDVLEMEQADKQKVNALLLAHGHLGDVEAVAKGLVGKIGTVLVRVVGIDRFDAGIIIRTIDDTDAPENSLPQNHALAEQFAKTTSVGGKNVWADGTVSPKDYNSGTGQPAFGEFQGEGANIFNGKKAINLRLTSAANNVIQGYTGSGLNDSDPWGGHYHDASRIYHGMSRGVGELYPRNKMSLSYYTKPYTCQSKKVAVTMTPELVTDMRNQFKIDVYKRIEGLAVHQISVELSREAVSKMTGLGWRNAINSLAIFGEKANYNMTYTTNGVLGVTPLTAWMDGDGREGVESMPYTRGKTPKEFAGVNVYETGDGMAKHLANQILHVKNFMANRANGLMPTFVLCNFELATYLQTVAQWTQAPFNNTISQARDTVYKFGEIFGLEIYVDPLIKPGDNRIVLGRKINDPEKEPGLVFAPYLMAERLELMNQFNGTPELIFTSRYAFVPVGHYPELSYFTFYVNLDR